MSVIDCCAVDPDFDRMHLSHAENLDGGAHRPEVVLFRTVIRQALSDFCSNRRGMDVQREQARRWLLESRSHFFVVCTLADLDPDHVRNVARQMADDEGFMIRLRHAMHTEPRHTRYG